MNFVVIDCVYARLVVSSLRRVLSVQEWEERRAQHNELENKRREILNDNYQTLQKLVKSNDASQSAVLSAAIGNVVFRHG